MTASSSKLKDATYAEIQRLSKEGNQLADAKKYDEAKTCFIQALRLVPEPHQDWEAATWLYAAVGDMHFHLGNPEKVMRSFTNAVQCPGGLGNPFVHLRLGQSHFELKNFEKAADELTRAYMGGGLEVFMEDDPKYLVFLETKISL